MCRSCIEKNENKTEETCERKWGTTLHENKLAGGKGRHPQSEIEKLQSYYGLAIRRNASNLVRMKRAVWAVFFHKLLKNENTQHGVCPGVGDNWCKFKNSACSGVAYDHKYPLKAAVVDAIEPVFRDLASLDFLESCAHEETQKRN
jgi:hypothetical protein